MTLHTSNKQGHGVSDGRRRAHVTRVDGAGRRKAAAHHPDRELVAQEERDEERDENHEKPGDCDQRSQVCRQFGALASPELEDPLAASPPPPKEGRRAPASGSVSGRPRRPGRPGGQG